MKTPLVSVVIATYNSSHLLRYALRSLQLSTLEDWEAIIVGDHCTDDSETCVAEFDDTRMRFINLEKNSGQQATPNNRGVAEASGEFLSFLNHDDMFLPWHLSAQIRKMEQLGADILCCPTAVIPVAQLEAIAEDDILTEVEGFSRSGEYEPRNFHVASSWMMRRQTALILGAWRTENKTFVTPSQDWLFRAWRRGADIRCSADVSVVVLYCGARKDSYRTRECPEHEFVFQQVIGSDRLRGRLLDAARLSMVEQAARFEQRWATDGPWLRTRGYLDAILCQFGIHPHTPRMIVNWGGRGGLIRHLKRETG